MVLSGKTSSGGAGAPKHFAQRTSSQQLQTEHPAEWQVSQWSACLCWSAVALLVGSSTSVDNINRSTSQEVESLSKQLNACWLIPFYNLFPVFKQDANSCCRRFGVWKVTTATPSYTSVHIILSNIMSRWATVHLCSIPSLTCIRRRDHRL